MVFPRTLLAGYGTAPLREALFSASETVVDSGLNKGQWIFPDVHAQYTLVALAARKNSRAIVSTAGPAISEKAWSLMPDSRIDWSVEELSKATEGLEVPLIPDVQSATLFRKLVANGQRFDAPLGASFRSWAPINATTDHRSGLLREHGKGWPVYSGDNFDLWTPEVGNPPFVLGEKEGMAFLQRKRQRSSVWKGIPTSLVRDPRTLPQYRSHILFRDVTNRTNSRTVIAALVPPKRFATNTAPMLLRFGGGPLDDMLRLAVMCSLPFDWCARRRVEIHLNFFILNALPVPTVALADHNAERAASLAARLACIDERFDEFARACGIAIDPPNGKERLEAIAEIDALVASMYGLDAQDLETIFSDFTSEAVPEERRQAIRDQFACAQEKK